MADDETPSAVGAQASEGAQETPAPEESRKTDGRTAWLGVRVSPAESERARRVVVFAYELGIIPEKTMQALLLRGLNHVYNEVRQAYQQMRDGRP